jgi:hypothetical protein
MVTTCGDPIPGDCLGIFVDYSGKPIFSKLMSNLVLADGKPAKIGFFAVFT